MFCARATCRILQKWLPRIGRKTGYQLHALLNALESVRVKNTTLASFTGQKREFSLTQNGHAISLKISRQNWPFTRREQSVFNVRGFAVRRKNAVQGRRKTRIMESFISRHPVRGRCYISYGEKIPFHRGDIKTSDQFCMRRDKAVQWMPRKNLQYRRHLNFRFQSIRIQSFLSHIFYFHGYELHCGIIFLFRKFCRCRETTVVQKKQTR